LVHAPRQKLKQRAAAKHAFSEAFSSDLVISELFDLWATKMRIADVVLAFDARFTWDRMNINWLARSL